MTNEKVLPQKLEPGKDQVVSNTSSKAPETDSKETEFLAGSRETKRGDRGEDVKVLQRRLGLEPTGTFNEDTEERVKWLQEAKGLKETGTFNKDVYELLHF